MLFWQFAASSCFLMTDYFVSGDTLHQSTHLYGLFSSRLETKRQMQPANGIDDATNLD